MPYLNKLSPTIRRALAFGVLVVAAALIYRFYPSGAVGILTPEYTRAESGNASSTSRDSDQDGVPDWQERLVGSDPYDAASTPSPLDLYLAPEQIGDTGVATDTPTSMVARSLLDQYVALKNSGIYSAAAGEQIASAIADNLAIPVSFTPYAEKNVLVSDSVTKAQYRAAMQDATKPLVDLPAGESELALFGRASQSGNQALFAQVLDTANTYEAVADTMMKVAVPTEAKIFHLNAVNSLGGLASVLRAMVANNQDPIASLVLLRTYNEAESALLSSFTILGTYYRGNETQ